MILELGYIPMGREKMIKVTNLLFSGKFHWRSVDIENLIGNRSPSAFHLPRHAFGVTPPPVEGDKIGKFMGPASFPTPVWRRLHS